jgi:hypothetical protein
MKIETHHINGIKIVEVISENVLIQNSQDGLQLLVDIGYQGFDRIIIYEKNITPDFFDLKNKIAGDILQKYSNYRVRLVIIGEYSKFTNKSIRDFIYESNKFQQINFVSSLDEALAKLSKN